MQQITILGLTGIASAPVLERRFVNFADAPAGAGEKVKGVAEYAAAAGGAYKINVLGTSVVKSGAAFAKGVAVASDATSRAVLQAGVAVTAGYALSEATAADQDIEILLTP